MSKKKTDLDEGQRRFPLVKKLSIEQNLTNLIEKESPLLQSELLTAEHELSVLRSRLAINEGVAAITGTILESLKGEFERPKDCSIEIFYDRAANGEKTEKFIMKNGDKFWIGSLIDFDEAKRKFDRFSSTKVRRGQIFVDSSSDEENGEKENLLDEIRSTFEFFNDRLSDSKTFAFFKEKIESFGKEFRVESKICDVVSEEFRSKSEEIRRKIFREIFHEIKRELKTRQTSRQTFLAETFLTTEEKNSDRPSVEIFHEIQQISVRNEENYDRETILRRTSRRIVEEVLQRAIENLSDEQENQRSFSSSSSSDDEESFQFLTLNQTHRERDQSLRELSTLVAELEQIEDQIEDRFDTRQATLAESKSVNELDGLIQEFCSVTEQVQHKIHEQIFTETNIDALSHDLSQYRRQSLTLNKTNDDQQDFFVRKMIDEIIQQSREILLNQVRFPSSLFTQIDLKRENKILSIVDFSPQLDCRQTNQWFVQI